MGMQPLHEFSDSHLWDGSFGELAAAHIDPDDETLLVAPSGRIATTLKEDLIAGVADTFDTLTMYTDDDSSLPFDPDSFDAVVHHNPSRGVLQRHTPLYEMTAVGRNDATLVYRAPNYLAHSDAADLGTLYSLGWEDHDDPALAAVFTVTVDGDPRGESASAENHDSHSLSEFLDGGATNA